MSRVREGQGQRRRCSGENPSAAALVSLMLLLSIAQRGWSRHCCDITGFALVMRPPGIFLWFVHYFYVSASCHIFFVDLTELL